MPSHFDLKNAICFHNKTSMHFPFSKFPDATRNVREECYSTKQKPYMISSQKATFECFYYQQDTWGRVTFRKLNVNQRDRVINFTVYLHHLLYPLQQTGGLILGCLLSGTLEGGLERLLLRPSLGKLTSLLRQALPHPLMLLVSRRKSRFKHLIDLKAYFKLIIIQLIWIIGHYT